jgi:DNA-binding response OmpR family regulator
MISLVTIGRWTPHQTAAQQSGDYRRFIVTLRGVGYRFEA